MPNTTNLRPKDMEGRVYQPIDLRGGLDQETSKFVVQAGTLEDCLNYNSGTRGYQRAQGLFYYDGTFDSAVDNMFVVAVDDDESTYNPVGTGFTLGGVATWSTNSSGKVVYASRQSTYTIIGLVEMLGTRPAAGDTITDTETGSTLVLDNPLTHAPSDLASAVNPSTGVGLADTITKYLAFLNNSVNSALVSQTGTVAGTYTTYHGDVPGVGRISGGWQFNDSVYIVRDTYCTDFSNALVQFNAGDEVQVPYSGGSYETVMVAEVQLLSGSWGSAGTGRITFVPSTNTTDFRNLDNIDTSTYYIKDSTGSTSLALVSGNTSQYGGAVWKGTINGWEWVDTGWTLEYGEGTNAPNVKASPLFLSNLISASRTTAATAAASGSTMGSAPYIVWTNPNNVTADDGTNATCTLADGEFSQYLKIMIPADIIPHEDVRISGIKATVNVYDGSGGVFFDSEVRLVNDNAGDFYFSRNMAKRADQGTVAGTTVEYGGTADKWGLEEISAEDLNSGNMGIVLQYENESGAPDTINVDYVEFEITYVPKNERVWFYDGTNDVCEGTINAFQIDNGGDFGVLGGGIGEVDTQAEGNMSFTDMTAPNAVGVGMSMYSEPAGAGVLIGTVTANPTYNILPSTDQLIAQDSSYESMVANYYENDESEAVYVVTGASPAFTFDGTNFAFIRAPFDSSVDKPRHLAFHENRLALAFKSGHVILSSVAVPNDFSAVNSASSWGVGDRVTGILSLSGQVLGVFSEGSIRSLQGSSASDGTMRTVSSTSGAKEYTLQNVIGPYFADNRGVNSVANTDKYGDFDLGRVTDPIRSWLQNRMQNRRSTEALDNTPVGAVALRSKNQYRLFFADGYILVLYFRVDGSVEPTFMHYDTTNYSTDYVPTFLNSFILSNGRERVIMGTASGDVFIVDGANCIQHPDGITTPDCWVTLNPVNFGRPERIHKNYHVVVQGRFFGAQDVETWGDANYAFDETGPSQYDITFGSYLNTPITIARPEMDSAYLPILTDGFSVKMQTSMDGSNPHTFQSMLFRSSSKGMDRNRASKAY